MAKPRRRSGWILELITSKFRAQIQEMFTKGPRRTRPALGVFKKEKKIFFFLNPIFKFRPPRRESD